MNRRDLLGCTLAGWGATPWPLATAAPQTPSPGGSVASGPFELGVASGFPRPDGMVLWTRLLGPELAPTVTVQWELAADEAFRRVVQRGEEQAEAAWAHSVHVEPRDLPPGREYFYRFTALGERSPVGRTRTAPAPGSPATLKFATASCQRMDHGFFAAWRDITEFNPDLIIFLGDYIYETPLSRDPVRTVRGGLCLSLDDYRDRYAQYKRDPQLQAAHACAPWAVVWDDHEVENDYAGLHGRLPWVDFRARRAAAYQACWEHLPFPKAARPVGADMRIWGHLDWGRLARLHLLDGRQYRDPQVCPSMLRNFGASPVLRSSCPELADPARSYLGQAQEEALAQAWSLDRPWNLLAQQTLMSQLFWEGDPGDAMVWTDGWDGYAPARQRLLSTAAQRQVPGLVVLGGDVHSHYVSHLRPDFDRDPGPDNPVVGTEFCGTSIASRGASAAKVKMAVSRHPHVLYGQSHRRGNTLFTLTAQSLQVELRGVHKVQDPHSPVSTLQKFVVEAGRPQIHPA